MRLLWALIAVFTVLRPTTSDAGCRWDWDCSQFPCRQVQICDNTFDVPTIRPPEVPPIPAPSVRPVPMPTVPPVGTSQCQQAYLCNAWGQCNWQTVCR